MAEDNNINQVRNLVKKRLNMVSDKLEKKKRISYTGIVLDNRSKEKLKGFIKDMRKAKKIIIPDDWEFSADHITINMGPAMDPSILGQEIDIKVLTFAYDQNVIAVGVRPDMEIEYEKENPHITIAFNVSAGARPVMSNKLTDWKPVPRAFIISGTIQEVYENV